MILLGGVKITYGLQDDDVKNSEMLMRGKEICEDFPDVIYRFALYIFTGLGSQSVKKGTSGKASSLEPVITRSRKTNLMREIILRA
jgi:hypothetical protein